MVSATCLPVSDLGIHFSPLFSETAHHIRQKYMVTIITMVHYYKVFVVSAGVMNLKQISKNASKRNVFIFCLDAEAFKFSEA